MDSNIAFSDDLAKALEEFTQRSDKQIDDKLLRIIFEISQTGLTCYPWQHLKQLLAWRLIQVLDEHNSQSPLANFEATKAGLLGMLDGFSEPPFTIQRICELLVNPKIYNTTKKYVFALDKVLNVTSVQPTLTPAEFDAAVTQQRQKMQELRASDNAYADNAPQPSADGAETTQGTPDVEMEDPMQL